MNDIVTYPDELLRQEAEPIDKITAQTKELSNKMTEVLLRKEGVGLAAPQIGIGKQLIVVNFKEEFYILSNPKIVSSSDKEESAEEGCLSIPNCKAHVNRPNQVIVSGINLKGEEVRLTKEGIVARIFQHEIDHLKGILFIDRISRTERQILLRKYKKRDKKSE